MQTALAQPVVLHWRPGAVGAMAKGNADSRLLPWVSTLRKNQK